MALGLADTAPPSNFAANCTEQAGPKLAVGTGIYETSTCYSTCSIMHFGFHTGLRKVLSG